MLIDRVKRIKFRFGVLHLVVDCVNIITVLGEDMKKYLFDKIVIDCSTIRFYPYRSTTFLEFFTTNSCGTLDNDDKGKNTLCPKSFFEFLQCLKRTKIAEEDYHVYNRIGGESFKSSFDNLLKSFVNEIYKDKPANKDSIEKFYKSAYEIRTEAIQSAEILNKGPEQFLAR